MTAALLKTIIDLIAEANPNRNYCNLTRRVLKLIEELGEVAEAYLETTSANNRKNKSWADVNEEAADVLIVAIDIALTIDTPEALLEFVIPNLHCYTGSLDAVIRQICYATARFDGNFQNDRPLAVAHIGVAVCYAFSMNELLHRYDSHDNLLSEVNRKLDKWRSGTSTAEAAE